MRQKPGRKPKAATPGRRISLGLTVNPEVKSALDAAAARTGRTQSTEAAARIEASIKHEKAFDETLELHFGLVTGDLLMGVIGTVLTAAAEASRAVSHTAEHWFADPTIRDAVGTLLRFLVSGLGESLDTETPPSIGALVLRQICVRLMTAPEWLTERRERLGPFAGLVEIRVRKLQHQYECGPKAVIAVASTPLGDTK